jgi:hypothetical protein
MTIFGIPVVESDTVPADELWVVVGSGVERQDGTLERDGEVWKVTNIGDPYAVDSRDIKP